ncbi:polysaccharide deacetylase family protein [Ferrimonas marina]|uniref:Peptidoglycan/xylan/chitin deacetylase, PgdA/CDA1 family n=1 Tax=Ferrimonas marina TaxID=299255 RepID=A0A1M5Z9C4_9GAMM|nr:polysaccharide deacetylase family protein [Ferrimonas marina]SHI20825.1 Peptidoglycan/xylan/chitin deacetylase, PgdA/CDA1 family [Ferrimonas marina]
MLNRLKALTLGLVLGLASMPSLAVVILQYHHVSEKTPSITSVTPAQFAEQMAYLADNDFSVIPLADALAAIRAGEHLPAKTIVITFDDGFANIASNGHPILKQHGFPYTVFVNLEPIEQNRRNMMDWDTLRQIAAEGATIANHSYSHDHLIRRLPGEDQAAWEQRVEADIERTEAAIVREIGHNLKALAYPYGEYNQALQALLERMGYVGIGQHSGAAGPYSSLTTLPRYPVAGPYADMDSLRVKMHSLNMPMVAMDGEESELINRNRPSLTVTLEAEDVRTGELMCYIQGQGAKAPTWLDDSTFTIQADLPLPAGRSRYNCTAPSRTQNGYYWFSQPWIQANADGSWPQE